MTTHYCQHCNEPAAHVCGDCRAAHYCGAQCKNDDWVEAHRYECRAALATGAPFDDVPRRARERQRFPELEKRAEQVRDEHQRLTGELYQQSESIRATRLAQSEVARAMTGEQKEAIRDAMRKLFPSHREKRAQQRRDYLQRISEVADAAAEIPLASGAPRVARVDEMTRAHIALLFRMQDLLHVKQTLALAKPDPTLTKTWMAYTEEVKREQEAIAHRVVFHQERVQPEEIRCAHEKLLLRAMSDECARALWDQICTETASLLADAVRVKPAARTGLGIKTGLGGGDDAGGDEAGKEERRRAYERSRDALLDAVRNGRLSDVPRESLAAIVALLMQLYAATVQPAVDAIGQRVHSNTVKLKQRVVDRTVDAVDTALGEGETRNVLKTAMSSAGVSLTDWDWATVRAVLSVVAMLFVGFFVLGLSAHYFDGLGMTDMDTQRQQLHGQVDALMQQRVQADALYSATHSSLSKMLSPAQVDVRFTDLTLSDMNMTSAQTRALLGSHVDSLLQRVQQTSTQWQRDNVIVEELSAYSVRKLTELCGDAHRAMQALDARAITGAVERLQRTLTQAGQLLTNAAPEVVTSVERFREAVTFIGETIAGTVGASLDAIPARLAQIGTQLNSAASQLAEAKTLHAAQQFDAPTASAIAYKLGLPELLMPHAAQPVVDSWLRTVARLTGFDVAFAFGAGIERRVWALGCLLSVAYASPSCWQDMATALFYNPVTNVGQTVLYTLLGLLVTRNLLQMRFHALAYIPGLGSRGMQALWRFVEWATANASVPYGDAEYDGDVRLLVENYNTTALSGDERILDLVRQVQSDGLDLVTFGRACDMIARNVAETADINRTSAYIHSWRPLRETFFGHGSVNKVATLAGLLTLHAHYGLLGGVRQIATGAWRMTAALLTVAYQALPEVTFQQGAVATVLGGVVLWLVAPSRRTVRDGMYTMARHTVAGCAWVLATAQRHQLKTFVVLSAMHFAAYSPAPWAYDASGALSRAANLFTFNTSAVLDTGSNTLADYERLVALTSDTGRDVQALATEMRNAVNGATLYQQVQTSTGSLFGQIYQLAIGSPDYVKGQMALREHCTRLASWLAQYMQQGAQ